MSSDVVRRILESRLKTEWNARTPIIWDNSNVSPIVGVSFIRCSLDEIDSDTISINCTRDFDVLTIQVFTPKGAGSSANIVFCDAIKAIFRNYSSGTLLCKKIVNERVGEYKEWYQRNVLIDVQTDTYS